MEDKYRSFIYGEGEKNTHWRLGAPPNYDVVNELFEQGRTQEWAAGSLEERVQRLVKTMEMELVHKTPPDYKSINADEFRFSVNGSKGITAEEIGRMGGSYNAFLRTSLPEELRYYDPAKETFESSNAAFKTAFSGGFALEVLRVYRGPPTIVFKFRHWGFMDGPYKGHAPTGDKVELHGMAIFQVDDGMRIESVELFYDGGELVGGLLKGAVAADGAAPNSSRCPFMNA